MDIVRKSKNSESLCDHCRYAQDCTVYVSIGKCYDILSCAMDRPLPSIPPNIDYHNPRKKKEKEKDIPGIMNASEFIKSLTTFTKDDFKKIQDIHNQIMDDFKKKSIDEKLNIIYERLIGI